MFAPLLRATLFTVAVLLLTGSLDAQPPPADPDAKGTVTITKVTPSGTTLSVSGDRSAVGGGWVVGGVKLVGIHTGTRRLYIADIQLKAGKTTWEGAISDLPNAKYRLYALHTLAYSKDGKTDSQVVASAFHEGTINVMNNPNDPAKFGGAISIDSLVRENGGVWFQASGTWGAGNGYIAVQDTNDTITVVSFPVGGGVYRPGVPQTITGLPTAGTWSKCQFNVNGALKYNVAAMMRFERHPDAVQNDTRHFVSSEWKENQ
jgi:hypothetical protein